MSQDDPTQGGISKILDLFIQVLAILGALVLVAGGIWWFARGGRR